MSSTTLPSRSFPAAQPRATGSAARALVQVITGFAALLRGAADAAASRRRAMRQIAQAKALHELSLKHLPTNPSYAADLLAAARQVKDVVEQA